MDIHQTAFEGLLLFNGEQHTDERGSFTRVWCQEHFQQLGITTQFVQSSVCHNHLKGTLRGLHFQWPPSTETKLVRCIHGSIYDVVVDVRPNSSTFMQHFAVTLSSKAANALLVPEGFAHSYQTLEDNSVLLYMMSDVHQPDLATGFRYNDPAFGISYPLPVSCIIDRDKEYPDFKREDYTEAYSKKCTSHKVAR